jgi:hypothetical protein
MINLPGGASGTLLQHLPALPLAYPLALLRRSWRLLG